MTRTKRTARIASGGFSQSLQRRAQRLVVLPPGAALRGGEEKARQAPREQTQGASRAQRRFSTPGPWLAAVLASPAQQVAPQQLGMLASCGAWGLPDGGAV